MSVAIRTISALSVSLRSCCSSAFSAAMATNIALSVSISWGRAEALLIMTPTEAYCARPEARLLRLSHFATAFRPDAVAVRLEGVSVHAFDERHQFRRGKPITPFSASGTCPRPALTVRVCRRRANREKFGAQPGRPRYEVRPSPGLSVESSSIAWATSVPAASEPATAQQKGEVNVNASIS
ncbi:hypothetical protein [Mesorhizobium sp. M0895]|uniref:hypothetical protein n=1 Tax=Mesorhizobium sp. M0895 TaxID=2957019 RepID=UPI00333AB5CD